MALRHPAEGCCLGTKGVQLRVISIAEKCYTYVAMDEKLWVAIVLESNSS